MVDALTQSLEKKDGRENDGKRGSADDINWSHSLLLEAYARNILPPKVMKDNDIFYILKHFLPPSSLPPLTVPYF